ncbi:sulfur transport [Carpediemonas membranifera]|uniref:Sulfur transport n=1 Tax=Carpediemonas membranifera TaxID=201153 RepID=A0A8J6E6X4_9EUKA|nr:sulfur transport [Carpediemonas membranifera]|eukprot:KAG9397612.1 sulfur transport [Carpediemonas membranifera]
MLKTEVRQRKTQSVGETKPLNQKNASKNASSAADAQKPSPSMFKHVMYYGITFFAGFLFAFGLALSNMTNPNKVLRFLAVADWLNWDPSLGFVMGGGLIFTFIAFQILVRALKKPLLADKFGMPTNNKLAWNLVIGPIIFGIGWGIGGICPGPGIVNLVSTNWKMYVWFFGVCIGLYLETFLARFNVIYHKIKSM